MDYFFKIMSKIRVCSVCGLKEVVFSPSLFSYWSIKKELLLHSEALIRSTHMSFQISFARLTGEAIIYLFDMLKSLIVTDLYFCSDQIGVVNHCTYTGGLLLVPLTWVSQLYMVRHCWWLLCWRPYSSSKSTQCSGKK